MIQRAAGGFERQLEILQDEFGLKLDVRSVKGEILAAPGVRRHTGLEVAGKLPGGENEIADANRFGIIRERLGRLGLDH